MYNQHYQNRFPVLTIDIKICENMHIQTFLRICELDMKIIESEKWLINNLILSSIP